MNYSVNTNTKMVDIASLLAMFKTTEDEPKVVEEEKKQEEDKSLFEIGGNGEKSENLGSITDIESAIRELDRQELSRKSGKSFATREKRRNELNTQLERAEFREEQKKNDIASELKDKFVDDKITVGNITAQINELHNENQKRELIAILNEMKHIKASEEGSMDRAVDKLDLVQ